MGKQEQQLAGLQETMANMLGLFEKLTPVIKAQAKAMKDLGDSAEDVTKKTERVETGLGKFIQGTLRATSGKAGIFHKMMYGVGGYFIFKNRMDTLLSGIDKYIARPLAGLKGEDGKQGLIGKMFFGIGGSYRKTKEQLSSVMGVIQDGEFQGPKNKRTSALQMSKGSKLGSARSLMKQALMQKIVSNKAVKFYNMQKKGQKFTNYLAGKGKKWMKSAGSALKSVGIMGVMALKFFFAVTLALIVVYGIVKLLRKAGLDGEKLKEIGFAMWDAMQFGLGIIWESLSLIWEGAKQMYDGLFGDGDLSDALMGWLKIAGGILGVLFGVAVALVWPLLVGVWEIAKVVFWSMVDSIKNASKSFFEKHAKTLKKITNALIMAGAIVAIIGGAFAFLPAVIAGAVVMVIAGIIDWINPFAAGGVTKSGMSLVGEKGPELVRLPKGSRVHSNQESKQMMSGGGGNNITVNVQGRIGASDSELRLIAQKVGQMINKEINRTTSSRGLGA